MADARNVNTHSYRQDSPQPSEQQTMPEDEGDDRVDVSGNGSAEPVVDPNSFTLTKPIQAHGDEIKVLRWREPTGGDIERAGNPINIEMFGLEQPRLSFDEKKMTAMISLLCAIPPSSVRQITASDWNSIAWRMVGFFMPNMGI
jgi:hypothetical protein